jgi:hypothetical protein
MFKNKKFIKLLNYSRKNNNFNEIIKTKCNKNICLFNNSSGSSNGDNDDDYLLIFFATYLSYYYQK